jgi:hypothetical protein
MPDQKWLIYIGLLLLGAVLAPQIRKIPVLGPKLPA